MTKLTPESCRAARAILKWSIRDLASVAGLAFSTIYLFERNGRANAGTVSKIVETFAEHNVEITNGSGTGARLAFNKPNHGADD